METILYSKALATLLFVSLLHQDFVNSRIEEVDKLASESAGGVCQVDPASTKYELRLTHCNCVMLVHCCPLFGCVQGGRRLCKMLHRVSGH